MQAVGVLKPHQEDRPGHPWLPPEPARRNGCSLTDCMQAGPRRTRDHAGWGGQVKTEQRRRVNAGTLQKQAASSLVATMASPDGHSLAKTRGQDHMGSRESREWGHTRVDTCTQDSRAFLPCPPTCPGYACASPSFTEMVGFFCRNPNRMKKRTSGMKISKARTH